VVQIGKHLHAHGGTPRMQRVFEMALRRNYSICCSYLDCRWNGIGMGTDDFWLM
jgi:hypothetical protein